MTVLLREAIGDRLRHARTNQSRTLREISRAARVSLGYLSEIERGQKEASSELLASICDALELPLGELLNNVATDVSALETVEFPAAQGADAAPGDGAEQPVGEFEGGTLVSGTMGNDLSDLRVSGSTRISPALRTTIGQPKMAVSAA